MVESDHIDPYADKPYYGGPDEQVLGQKLDNSVVSYYDKYIAVFRRIEAEMEALNGEKAKLEEGLSSGQLAGDELTCASVRIGEVMERLDELEMRWLELSI